MKKFLALLLAALMIGINVGVGIIISRYFGQKNEELMRRAFVNSRGRNSG